MVMLGFTTEPSGGVMGLSAKQPRRTVPIDNPKDAIIYSTFQRVLVGSQECNKGYYHLVLYNKVALTLSIYLYLCLFLNRLCSFFKLFHFVCLKQWFSDSGARLNGEHAFLPY